MAQSDAAPAVGEQVAVVVAEEPTKWLALLIREGLMVIVSGIERRYGLRRRVESRFECPRCSWRG